MPRIGVSITFLIKVLTLACLFPASFVQAAVFYIDQKNPAASDANPGTKVAPWLSLEPISKAKLSPGDTILIREGIYEALDSAANSDSLIELRDSGKPGKPIVIKSSPQFAATLQGQSKVTAPVLISNQDYISIEGFRIVNPGKHGILIQGSKNNPVKGIKVNSNLIIDEHDANNRGMMNGIYIRYTKDSMITNNRIINTSHGIDTTRSSAVRISHSTNHSIERNDIENLAIGINITGNSQEINIHKNIFSRTQQPVIAESGEHSEIRHLSVANNVFNGSEITISFTPDGGLIRKSEINNNVFNNYSVAALQIAQPGMGKVKIWNNIFSHAKPQAEFISDIVTYDDPPLSIARMDYNLFAQEPVFITGLYSTNRHIDSLRKWRSFSELDSHSVVKQFNFRNPEKNDFRLSSKSRRILRGTRDGRTSSSRMDIGAYTTRVKQIGTTRPGVREQQHAISSEPSKRITAPSSKTVKQAESTKIRKSTVVTQAMASRSANTSANKIEAKPDQVKSVNKNDSSEQLALVNPELDKIMAKPRRLKLEWDVDRWVRFKGKCVLESNKIDFFDGYDNTGLKFRMLDNQLFLITRSNIDLSHNDVGIQVGKNEFLHADNIVRDQHVVMSKELPKLLTQLRKSSGTSEAKIQLRFWPTYPATKAYSQVVTLDGFLPAYQEYMDCQQGK